MHTSALLLTCLSTFFPHPQETTTPPPAAKPPEAPAVTAAAAPAAPAAPAPVAFRADQVNQLAWRHIGPVNMSGRVTDFEVSGDTWYIGTAAAGVWRSDNRGTTWKSLFAKEAVCSIGDVAVAPTNPDIVWVGSGEDNARNSVSWGDGVYKSTDGGATWKHMGLSESFQIGHIAIHPENPEVVFVAALGKLWGPNRQRGIFRSKDGGATWEHVFFLDDKTGCIDIRFHPKTPTMLWAAMYERKRNAFDDNDPEVRFGEKAGLFRSTDGGDTWTRMTQGLPTCKWGRSGLDVYGKNPDTLFMIVETERSGWATGTERTVASAERSNRAFLGLQSEDEQGGGARVTLVSEGGPADQAGLQDGDIVILLGDKEIKASADLTAAIGAGKPGSKAALRVRRGGEEKALEVTFGERPAQAEVAGGPPGAPGRGGSGPNGGSLGGQRANVQDDQGEQGHETGGVFRSDDQGVSWKRLNSLTERPFYYSWICVDPNDDQRIFTAGTTLWTSSNGGANFAGTNPNSIHVDFHTVWVDPEDSNHVVSTCDGGVNVSRDRGRSWEMLPNLPIGQFYHVDADNAQPYNVAGGLQDNGTWLGASRSRYREGIGWDEWIKLYGGDGFGAAFDQENPNIVFCTSQGGALGKYDRSTHRTSGVSRPRVRGKTLSFNWDTPFFLSPHNSKILYWAGNYPLRSLDQGRNGELLKQEPLGLTTKGTATAFAESPRQAGLLYVGTDDGALWRSDDHGTTWVALHEKVWGLPGPRYVSSIHPSAHHNDRVYVSFDGHRSNDFATHVFVSDDKGNTWRSLVANLPAECTHVVCEDQVNQDLLFVGTELGCWASLDRGKQWFALGKDLPTVPVRDLVIQSRENELVAATHGRGIWIIDITPLRQLTDKVAASPAHLFAPENAILWRLRSRGTQGDKNFYASNPPYGATVHLWLAEAPAEAPKVTIHDVTGKQLATLTGKKTAGVQALQWGAQTGGRRGGGGAGGGGGFGGVAVPMRPGAYSARFVHGEQTLVQAFSLFPDPGDSVASPSQPTQPASGN
jgi:photosystem II stability/assembly factor-like uncharacterized protein